MSRTWYLLSAVCKIWQSRFHFLAIHKSAVTCPDGWANLQEMHRGHSLLIWCGSPLPWPLLPQRPAIKFMCATLLSASSLSTIEYCAILLIMSCDISTIGSSHSSLSRCHLPGHQNQTLITRSLSMTLRHCSYGYWKYNWSFQIGKVAYLQMDNFRYDASGKTDSEGFEAIDCQGDCTCSGIST